MAQKRKKKRTPRQPTAREAKLRERLEIEKDYVQQIKANSREYEAELKQDIRDLKAAHREEMKALRAKHRATKKQLVQAMRLIDRVASAAQTAHDE